MFSFFLNAYRKQLLVTFFSVVMTLSVSSVSASESSTLPGPLVDAEWLADNIDNVVVLDVRKDTDSFVTEGHIEGAILVNSKMVRVKPKQGGYELTGMIPNRNQYEQFMSAHGVATDSTVVITMQGNTPGHVAGAARLYWHMKYYGFDRVAMLDGGNRAWLDALGDLTEEATKVESKKFVAGKVNSKSLAKMKDVEQALKDGKFTLVDTRNLRFHIGLEKRSYVAEYGHIPGSRLFPYAFLHPANGAAIFYSADVLNNVLNSLNINKNSHVILYCNSAYECSSVWFAMVEITGMKHVQIYDGALNEWTMDGNHPMTRKITAD